MIPHQCRAGKRNVFCDLLCWPIVIWFFQGENNVEGAAFAVNAFAFNRDGAAVGFNGKFAESQSQTNAGGFVSGRINPGKAVENTLLILW